MIIDIHTHMINGKDLDALAAIGGEPMKKLIGASRGMTAKKPQTTDVAARVAQMDRFQISYQLATPIPTLDPNNMSLHPNTEVKLAQAINDSMARLTEQTKGRVLCVGSVPLASIASEGIKEMERAVKTLGLKGFMLLTNIKGKPLDLPEYHPFWVQAAKLNATVFIHPCDAVGLRDRSYEAGYDLMHVFGWPFETTLTLCRLVFSGIMEELPNLKIVSHHLGGMIPFYWGRIEESYIPEYASRTSVSLKRPLKEYFSKFFYDTAVGSNVWAIRCSYEIFGADQVVFATDAPFGPGSGDDRLELYPRIIRGMGLPQRDVEKILSENARRILDIK